jgi:predicted site-specific integrase-resolvase
VSEGVPQLLPLVALARALCVSPHTVRSWVKKGRLRPMRLCRRLLFHPDEIARFLAENSSHPREVANSRSRAESERIP